MMYCKFEIQVCNHSSWSSFTYNNVFFARGASHWGVLSNTLCSFFKCFESNYPKLFLKQVIYYERNPSLDTFSTRDSNVLLKTQLWISWYFILFLMKIWISWYCYYWRQHIKDSSQLLKVRTQSCQWHYSWAIGIEKVNQGISSPFIFSHKFESTICSMDSSIWSSVASQVIIDYWDPILGISLHVWDSCKRN